MNTLRKFRNLLSIFLLLGLVTSCDKDNDIDNPDSNPDTTPNYVLSLGITSNGTTAYYVVSTDSLMSGTISAKGNGIEQNGYYDYEQGNETVFCVGGLGLTDVKGLRYNNEGVLQEEGSYVFNKALKQFAQITPQEMLGVEIPDNPASGDSITFYMVDINSIAITKKVKTSILPLATVDWPSLTGLSFSENKVYLTYFPMNQDTWKTYVDTTYVAIFDYPAMTLNTIMKDTRTGPAGSWNAYNGIFQTESGDMYIMSNSAISNGFSSAGKNAAFLRIPRGATQFDNYYFDFETKSGGLKPAHIKYIGNGLVFAEVSTLNPQTAADRWMDKSLKCSIIDLNNQTIKDINEIPVHDGNGGRRFTAMIEGDKVYYPVSTSGGTYIYCIDSKTAKAVKGAKVSTTFVAGFFRLNQ